MSLATTVNQITQTELTYLPAVSAGVQAAEQSSAPGETKLQAVVNGVIAGSQIAEGAPNPTVAGIAALVNLTVSIFNATGLFNHKSTSAAS